MQELALHRSGLTSKRLQVRNRAAPGKVDVQHHNDGVTLLGTVLKAQQHRGDWIDPEFVAPEYAGQEMPDPIQRDRAETRLAIAEPKKTSPVTLFEVAVKRVLRLWVPLNRTLSDKVGFKANLAVNDFYFPAMLLAALGLWRARHNPALVSLWTTCPATDSARCHLLGEHRIRYPIGPFLAIFAAHGLLEMLKFSSVRLRGTSA